MIKRGLAPNTVRRRCGRAKQLFRVAVRKRLIDANPFAHLKSPVRANAERMFFFTREDTQKIMDACPDDEWRLIVALARFDGLRCPSEHLELKGEHVDWAADRFTVTSVKTAHIEGKETRLLPIVRELRPHLLAAFERAETGVEYVITRCRGARVNWADAVPADHRPGRAQAVAEAVPELAEHPPDRAGRRIQLEGVVRVDR